MSTNPGPGPLNSILEVFQNCILYSIIIVLSSNLVNTFLTVNRFDKFVGQKNAIAFTTVLVKRGGGSGVFIHLVLAFEASTST